MKAMVTREMFSSISQMSGTRQKKLLAGRMLIPFKYLTVRVAAFTDIATGRSIEQAYGRSICIPKEWGNT